MNVLLSSFFQKRWQKILTLSLCLAVGAFLYFSNLRHNPPGFFVDESSVAFNAHQIAQSGRDEFGTRWPLFFRAFGEYKNPIYIYLLAGLFRMTSPSIVIARSLSVVAGLACAILLGILGSLVSGRQIVGLLVGLTAALTPWLFELSRLVLEVALYPLVVTLFLLCVWKASNRARWHWPEALSLSGTLALITYTYSIGRLLGPLLAVGLMLFVSRPRIRGILLTWAAYGLTLVPLLVFQRRYPGVLTWRFWLITYIHPEGSYQQMAREFVSHYFSNVNPWRLFVIDSSKISEILHVAGTPPMLLTTAMLLVFGIVLVLRKRKINAWWLFILYATAVSIVPASLTNERFHLLRLSALPVFLIVLTIPALDWLAQRKPVVLFFATVLIVGQGLWFQWQYHASARSPQRRHLFSADYPNKILPAALARAGSQPVYLADHSARPGYIQAYWYALLQGIGPTRFVSLGFERSAPEGAVVITTESTCPRCVVIAESEPYTVYVAKGPPKVLTRLPEDAFRAELTVKSIPQALRAGQQATVPVTVKNTSGSVWLAGERSGSTFQVKIGNHWLDSTGSILRNDDGRTTLRDDLGPGKEVELSLVVNAPQRPGNYILEIDMLQEGVTWFGTKGSGTWRGRVVVH